MRECPGPRISKRSFALLALLWITGCSTTDAPLSYSPASPIQPLGPPAIGAVTATDLRHEDDPGWYGAVRGGFGNPIKVLRTPQPLADTVAAAFRAALAQRGALGSTASAPLALRIEIATFLTDQYINRECTIELRLTLRTRDGTVVYADAPSTDQHEDNDPFSVGIFGSVEKLRAFDERTLGQLIDRALLKPGFGDALQRARRPEAVSEVAPAPALEVKLGTGRIQDAHPARSGLEMADAADVGPARQGGGP